MSKNVPPPSASTQIADNPLVSIVYSPENSLRILGHDAADVLAKLQGAKISNLKTLESASELMHDGEVMAERIETFRVSLVQKVQAAASRFRDINGFEDFEITVTIKRWGLRSLLADSIQRLRGNRAQYLADEQEKARRQQAAIDAEQRRKNQEEADRAAAAAKKAGADKATVAQIKEDVMATPAPIVESRAATVAQSVGASVRYSYSAKITDLRAFLGVVLSNDVLFNTLLAAKPEIEAAFRKMASDQKELFNYAGATFDKKAVDVNRRGA